MRMVWETMETHDSSSPEQEIDFCTLGMFIVGKVVMCSPSLSYLTSLSFARIGCWKTQTLSCQILFEFCPEFVQIYSYVLRLWSMIWIRVTGSSRSQRLQPIFPFSSWRKEWMKKERKLTRRDFLCLCIAIFCNFDDSVLQVSKVQTIVT